MIVKLFIDDPFLLLLLILRHARNCDSITVSISCSKISKRSLQSIKNEKQLCQSCPFWSQLYKGIFFFVFYQWVPNVAECWTFRESIGCDVLFIYFFPWKWSSLYCWYSCCSVSSSHSLSSTWIGQSCKNALKAIFVMAGRTLYCYKHFRKYHVIRCHITDCIEQLYRNVFFHFSMLKLTHECIALVAIQVCYHASDICRHAL